MKIDTRNVQPLVKARKGKSHERQKQPGKKSDFQLACEEAGKNPGTVRRRMKPVAEGGQGMTLEQALSEPVKTRSECGRARRAKTSWGWHGQGDL